jgi:hypothetical protein
MRLESFIGGTPPVERKAFVFGRQKINLHVKGASSNPRLIRRYPVLWICAFWPPCRWTRSSPVCSSCRLPSPKARHAHRSHIPNPLHLFA